MSVNLFLISSLLLDCMLERFSISLSITSREYARDPFLNACCFSVSSMEAVAVTALAGLAAGDDVVVVGANISDMGISGE